MDIDLLYRLIGERIQRARQHSGISQEKLSKRLNMSRTSIVNIEAGRQRAPLHVLWQVAEELNTELALLLPKHAEYREQAAPIELNSKTVAEIEKAANGDSATKRNLTAFIATIKSKGSS